MMKVYIAGPYTKGDIAVNVKTMMDIANALIEKGFAPFVPLYSHFQHMAHPQPYEVWTTLDLEWVKCCDCLLRIPGESKGADAEVEYAKSLGIPVYYDVEDIIINNIFKLNYDWNRTIKSSLCDSLVHKFSLDCVMNRLKTLYWYELARANSYLKRGRE